jgi:hypothetical protein
MKVRELIEKLKKFNEDKDVMVDIAELPHFVNIVSVSSLCFSEVAIRVNLNLRDKEIYERGRAEGEKT